ncbi:fumarylacetoacetate hydrolase family protein [Sphingopyxis sp.]|uniref:fumarylacetoacetate hydrolase family protein n=1 Tax=Sphingopyxis sp. TaxID=1908224 RepID=UPI002B498F5C|nr:fumarylacetoacetate hydrolase family protein [Sphingopyxis sp.]HJS09755.1 fumarylacetoacetate hydrolase family protein [Sphingopyxis sp.]
MKFVLFGSDGRLGVLDGSRILDLDRAARRRSQPFEAFSTLVQLIETGDRGLDEARTLLEHFAASDDPEIFTALDAAYLHAPFPGRRLALAGSNNADHVSRGRTNMGRPATPEDVRERTREGLGGGFWSVSIPAAPGADIPYPRSSHGLFDFEGEVAIVLARGGKGVPAEGWKERVWGSTLLIDWSVRNHDLLSNKRPFYAHKVFDNSKSIGPWIAVDEVDPEDCIVETRVNGELRQKFNSGNMIHSYAELLAQISEDLTLLPGDMLSGGTGPGTAADSTVPEPDGKLPLDLFLRVGDEVEVSASGLGRLSATIVAYDGPVG